MVIDLKNYSPMIAINPPNTNEFEISLFGPGIGECVVVHLGNNDWMVVDSCLNPITKNPIALDYLKSINVDPQSAIKIIVASHWHADHIEGLSELIRLCPEAILSYSLALLKKEFLTLVNLFSGKKALVDRKTASTRELAKTIDVLERRCTGNSDYKSKFMVPTRSDQLLFQNQLKDVDIEVRALSPSNKSIHNALQEFALLIPVKEDFRRVIPAPKSNNNAIALWIRFGNFSALLGADLEETNDPLTGWSAIINSRLRPKGKSLIFKVPHHGSENAHSEDVWDEMIDDKSISILTTKVGGWSSLPKPSDTKRIKGHSPSVYCTNEPIQKKIKRDRVVEKTVKGVLKARKVLGNQIGHIQVRISADLQTTVNLKPPATII